MIELRKTTLSDEYRKKWNISIKQTDFYELYNKWGEKINDSLYRIGGFGMGNNENYIILLKQVESLYPIEYTKNKTKKEQRHLSNCESIIDKETGEEKKTFKEYNNVYLTGGLIYSCNNKYYNIETDDYYGDGKTMKSKEFLFIDNTYSFYGDPDKENEKGIWKINMNDGSYEIFK